MRKSTEHVMQTITSEPFIKCWLEHYPGMSGCSTTVYPITEHQRDITVYLDPKVDGRTASAWARGYVKRNSEVLSHSLFSRGDGTTPPYVTLFIREDSV